MRSLDAQGIRRIFAAKIGQHGRVDRRAGDPARPECGDHQNRVTPTSHSTFHFIYGSLNFPQQGFSTGFRIISSVRVPSGS